MHKIAVFTLSVFAFFVALYYICTRKKPIFHLKGNTFLSRQFFIALSSFLAIFSQQQSFAYAQAKNNEDCLFSKTPDLKNTSEWLAIRSQWLDLTKEAVAAAADYRDVIATKKQILARNFSALVDKGLIRKDVAIVLEMIYGEMIFHRLRSQSGETCYKPTTLGSSVWSVRENLEKRCQMLGEIAARGYVEESIIRASKETLGRDIEYLKRAEALFAKTQQTHQYDFQEEEALALLFAEGKVSFELVVSPSVQEAVNYIIDFYSLAAPNVAKRHTSENDFQNQDYSAFSEWAVLKKKWNSVHEFNGLADFRSSNIPATLAREEEELRNLLSVFTARKIISVSTAELLVGIYKDRVFHRLRSTSAITCYEPTVLGFKQQKLRDDIEARLKELRTLQGQGIVERGVLAQAEKNLAKDMEMVLCIEGAWKKASGKNWELYQKEEQKLLSYFINQEYDSAEIRDDFPVRPEMIEALSFIVAMNQ